MKPRYPSLSEKEWQRRIDEAHELLNPCRVCPRECGVDRTDPEAPTGFCGMKDKLVISSAQPHYGEERCLSGTRGSGTIFFTSCNLACVYCQNFEISQLRIGQEITITRLAEMMLELQKRGCHNINLVSPSIWVPQILEALYLAARGLANSPKLSFKDRSQSLAFSLASPKELAEHLGIPIVYNTGGYDRVETLKLLDGTIDIYMPDIKYSDNKMGLKYSSVPDYWDVVREAIKEMHRQVGDLVVDESGIAQRGLLVRHLVLPNKIAGTEEVMKFLAAEISKDTYINIMDQYSPTNKAPNYPELSRRTTSEEFAEVVRIARDAGLHRFDHTSQTSRPSRSRALWG